MHKYIGSDVTSMVTLPVIIFEPMTMLQKMAEVSANLGFSRCNEFSISSYVNLYPRSLLLLLLI